MGTSTLTHNHPRVASMKSSKARSVSQMFCFTLLTLMAFGIVADAFWWHDHHKCKKKHKEVYILKEKKKCHKCKCCKKSYKLVKGYIEEKHHDDHYDDHDDRRRR